MGKLERGNPEIGATFKALGGKAIKKSDLGNALASLEAQQGRAHPLGKASGGQPDYTVQLPPLGFYIEGKASPDAFAVDRINSKQREWLSEWSSISYLWLWLGENPPHYAPELSPREAFLVDWPRWLRLEAGLGRASLPFEGEQAARIVLAEYQLEWAGHNVWTIPAAHPFWAQRLAAARLFVSECERSFKGAIYGQQLSIPGARPAAAFLEL